MKKILIAFGVLFVILMAIFLMIGDYKITPNQNSKPLTQTVFYNKFYNTDKILIVNVWSTGIKTIVQEDDSLLSYFESNNIEFISLSTSTDFSKIKKNFKGYESLRKYDLTQTDFDGLAKIFEVIKFKDINDNLVKVSFDITPYIVIIKNKKVYYTANEVDIKKIKQIVNTIQKDTITK
jgi:hypothetical protein